jgi:hypothetical protein
MVEHFNMDCFEHHLYLRFSIWLIEKADRNAATLKKGGKSWE